MKSLAFLLPSVEPTDIIGTLAWHLIYLQILDYIILC